MAVPEVAGVALAVFAGNGHFKSIHFGNLLREFCADHEGF